MAWIGEAGRHTPVLGSSDPTRLAAWYQAAFAPGIDVTESMLQLRGRSSSRSATTSLRRLPNRVGSSSRSTSTNCPYWSHIRRRWTWRVRPMEQQIPVGTIATVDDADGNVVDILELDE
jgi:hypothetical protein